MQDNTKKWVELVAKLNAQTQDGKIQWTRQSLPEATGLLSSFAGMREEYTAPYKDKLFRLRVSKPASAPRIVVSLEIADAIGATIVALPEVVGMADLYESIRLHHSGIGQFIDEFLKDQ